MGSRNYSGSFPFTAYDHFQSIRFSFIQYSLILWHLSFSPISSKMLLLCRPFFSSFVLLICFVFFSSCRFFPSQGTNSNTSTKCANTENRGHSYLWTVRHPLANGTVHLFGYLRVPANLVWPSVSQEVKRQFSESDVAVFESDDKGIEQLAECIRRQKEGEKENLNASLGERLGEFLRRTELLLPPIPEMQWAEISTEWLVPSLLHLLSNRELSQSPAANDSEIDTILKQEAKLRGKRLEFIEHLPELCDYLPSFSHQQLEFAIEHIITELEATEKAEVDLQQSSTRTGIRLYNCGMFEAVDDLIGQSFLSQKAKGQTEKLGELNKRLISDVFTRRNERWIQKIIQLIEQNSQKRIFFAFGTGHLLGNGSIAKLLRLHGYSVDEQQFEQKVEKEMNENATAKSSVNQQMGNSLFWTLFAVAFAILCALALFGVVGFLVIYEQNRGKAVNEQSIIMASLCQNGRFLINDTEGQKANNENASLCKNGHIVTNDKEGQKADNEIVKN